uniref:Uncharacterized protein n=1 Tax=Rhizophora mucronata TaxID=61149 RepID=A0A2P2KZK6_RHIMU
MSSPNHSNFYLLKQLVIQMEIYSLLPSLRLEAHLLRFSPVEERPNSLKTIRLNETLTNSLADYCCNLNHARCNISCAFYHTSAT